VDPTTPARDEHVPAAPGANVLVIGANPLASRICGSLERSGCDITHLDRPDDAGLVRAMAQSPAGVLVALHDDVSALRYALAVAHIDPDTRIVVTIFDRTIAAQVGKLLPQAIVTSAADVAAPVLADACMRAGARRRTLGTSLSRWMPRLRSFDSHTQLLMWGVFGLAVVLGVDWTWLSLGGHQNPVEALLEAARVIATVGPGPSGTTTAYSLFSALAIITTVVLTAMFTAGLVQRLLEPGLLGVFGRRSAPRANHVIVVGMGQVGIRLCTELRRRGVAVIGVERNPEAEQLRLARALKIPVVVGHGIDREPLVRLRLRHARALAAVGSNELDNIAVAVAADAVSPSTPVVLRAGEQEAIAETRSLLALGTTEDVLDLTARFMTRAITAHGAPAAPVPHRVDRVCAHAMS